MSAGGFIQNAGYQFIGSAAAGAQAAGKKPDYEKMNQFNTMITTAVNQPVLSWFLVCIGLIIGFVVGFLSMGFLWLILR